MSILQDLDPQNAKIYRPEASRGKKAIYWIAGTLALATWGIWIAFTLQNDSKLSPTFAAVKSDALAASASSPAKVLQENPPQAIPPVRETEPQSQPLSAIINDDRNTTKKSEEEKPPASQSATKSGEKSGETADAGASPPAKPAKLAETSKAKNKPPAKTAAKAAPKQLAKTAAQDKMKKEKPPAIASKKAAERDVDIISAIVR